MEVTEQDVTWYYDFAELSDGFFRSYDTAIPPLGFYIRETYNVATQKSYTKISIVALFTTAPTGNGLGVHQQKNEEMNCDISRHGIPLKNRKEQDF